METVANFDKQFYPIFLKIHLHVHLHYYTWQWTILEKKNNHLHNEFNTVLEKVICKMFSSYFDRALMRFVCFIWDINQLWTPKTHKVSGIVSGIVLIFKWTSLMYSHSNRQRMTLSKSLYPKWILIQVNWYTHSCNLHWND